MYYYFSSSSSVIYFDNILNGMNNGVKDKVIKEVEIII